MANPDEFNILTNVQFKFEIVEIPDVTYYVQEVILPSIQVDSPTFPGPRRDIPMPGTKVSFDPLMITFLVDEDLNNYYEIYKWCMDIQRSEDQRVQRSDGVLHMLTGQMNINRQIRLVGLHPIMMTELPLSSTSPDTEGVTCTVSFQFQYFDFPAKDERIGTDNPLTFQPLTNPNI